MEGCRDVERLSFFGLVTFLGRIDGAIESSGGSAELEEAQMRLRREMGTRLTKPALTKRERPLAEDFLQQQLRKLKKEDAGDGKAAQVERAIERLNGILADVRSAPVVPESRAALQAQKTIDALEAEWKELSPLHDRWEKGKHSFKSNADLQAFRRRYEDCRKARVRAVTDLEEARCRQSEPVKEEVSPTDGFWSPVQKPATAKVPSPVRVTSDGRGEAARKLDTGDRFAGTAKKPKRPTAESAWGNLNFAQRLQASMTAEVRAGAEEPASFPAMDVPPAPPVDPPPPPPPPRAKPIAAQAVSRAKEEEADGSEVEAEAQVTGKQQQPKAKKKAVAKRKAAKGEAEAATQPHDTGSEEARKPGAGASIVKVFEAALRGSLILELLQRSAWAEEDPWSEVEPDDRFKSHVERLPWTNPLGLSLPLPWADFFALELDGGPRRTSSRRGPPDWLLRLQANMPRLFAQHLLLLFFFLLLQALSCFGLLLWFTALQGGIILAPPEAIKRLTPPARVLVLQGAHLLLWLCFIRALWTTPFVLKVSLVAASCAHAYVVAPVPTD